MSGSLWGSPPRMRGKEEDHHQRPGGGRITPAHAGKSQFPGPSPALPRDHPRACGEKTFKTYELDVSRGSPPRMRGKVLPPPLAALHRGITPAYAGKSYCSRRRGSDPQDHPRVCGEKHTAQRAIGYAGGSPPRMRGKVMFAILGSVIPRITPAYAGKRHSVFGYGRNTRDHPRVCGEKCEPKHDLFNEQGSPPRMRGKGISVVGMIQLIGITPAYAGKSFTFPMAFADAKDHPRVCGEKSAKLVFPQKTAGSPPRMRGKETAGQHCRRLSGITPAYAGKRPCSCRAMRRYGDHPRVCGEKTVMHNVAANKKGSPPRMRGKVRSLSRPRPRHRITPAYAGKSVDCR